MSEPVKVVKLQYPVKHGSQTVTEIVFQNRPKSRHIKHLKGESTFGDLLHAAGLATGTPKEVLDELDIADSQELVGIMSDFLASGR